MPHVRAQQSGLILIVNISSIVEHRALPGGMAYAAIKAAQITLTDAARRATRQRRLRLDGPSIGTATEFAEVGARRSPIL